MPGMSGGGIYGNTGKKGAEKKTGPGGTKKGGEYDNLSLPPGYQVPQEPPEAFNTDKEWVEDPGAGDKKVTNRMDSDFRAVMQAGEFKKDSDKDLVVKMIKYRLAQFTQKEFREKAADLRIKLEKDLEASNNKPPPRAARILALKTIAEEAPRLFQYHFVARLQGAILLAHLSEFNETDAEGTKKAAVPCTRAVEPLIEMVSDKQQLTAIRLWGVNGLVRLASLDAINSQIRNRIVDLLVAQMNASSTEHEWYQLRLAEGLGKLTVIQNQDKRPVVPQALATVLADNNRPLLVRAEAAQSLGRLQYDSAPAIDVGLLAFETARLTQQIIDGYNKDRPAGKAPKQAIWKLCLIRIYGGFKPLEDEEVPKDKTPPKRGLLLQVEGKPALNSHRKTVQEAYELILPLVTSVVGDAKDKDLDGPLTNLKKWIEQNQPKSFKINPDEPPIVSGPATPTTDPNSGVAAGTAGGRQPAN
ncbi:MAG: hypothetical protein JSS02_24875 [Planctomycetes bacterium]|nr:hypothetical protein [Planctomycetota bacterium]